MDGPVFTSYLDLFEKQCETKSNAVAVKAGDRSLTYFHLGKKVNQLANFLIKNGATSKMLIGVSATRSPEMIVSLLAIHRIGAAYVPLDPAYPPDKLKYMVEDSGLKLVLGDQAGRFIIPDSKMETIDVSQIVSSLETEKTDYLRCDAEPESLAYVIYTSGSTGHPKGVMVTHANLLNFVNLASRALPLRDDDIYLQSASINYAVSVRQIFTALSYGLKLVIARSSAIQDPIELFQLIKDEKITLADFVPSHWRSCIGALKALPERERVELLKNDLRRIVTIGEPLLPDLPLEWRDELHHPARMVNIFGQTETTGFITSCDISQAQLDSSMVVSIGRPIPDTQIYIVDHDSLAQVEDGEIGELCVSNACVARGYLNNRDLTSAKFVANPFAEAGGHMLYRTGDFARYAPDGTVEYLGRSDQQVKVRGIRVELGEIEAALGHHPGIREAVVLAREDVPGDKRLVAYLVTNSDAATTPGELRLFLRQKLSDYMIPSVFVFLDAMPLAPGGKLDRRALPAPDQAQPELEGRYIAPSTPVEEVLAKIWAEVLGLKRIGIRDNFFALGGHSLLAVRLISRIERKFGIRMPVATLFQYSTIAELAKLLEAGTLPQSWSSLMPIQPEGSRLPFFWVHGDSSTVLLPEYLGPDQPLYALEHQAHDGRPARHTQTETIAKHYLDEVRKVRPHGPYLLGGFSFGAVTAFEMAQQLRQEGEQVLLLFMLDPPPSIKRKEEPPVRPALKEEFKRHWTELSHAGFRKKLDYLAPRVKDKVLGKTVRIRKYLKKLRCRCYLTAGRLLPVSLRSGYILDIYGKALRSYVPQSYPGRVMLCKSEKALYRPSMDWLELCRGELKVYELDGKYTHVELTKEPCVAQWAQRLKAALDGLHSRTELRNRQRWD
jgi:amino acid adenylation domain-containing protein